MFIKLKTYPTYPIQKPCVIYICTDDILEISIPEENSETFYIYTRQNQKYEISNLNIDGKNEAQELWDFLKQDKKERSR